MSLDPFKHVKRRGYLFGRDEPGEDVILEEMMGRIVLLFLLIDEACVMEMGDVGHETLFGDFSEGGLLQKGQKRLVLGAPEDAPLHLPFGGLPGGGVEGRSDLLDDKETVLLKGLGAVIEEARRSQIDPPAFCRMFDIGIGFFRVVG